MADDVDAPGNGADVAGTRWNAAKPWSYIFGVGWVLGVLIALTGQTASEEFITDSWSYRPREQWWLHGLMVAVVFVGVFVGVRIAYRLLGLLFSTRYPFAIVGAFLVVMAGVLVVLGLQSDARSDRVGFAAIAALPGLVGVLMVWANFAPPRRKR